MSKSFISIGIDVGSKSSWVSVVAPDYKVVIKPFVVFHSKLDSLKKAVLKIRKAEELYSLKARIFLESTGNYHIPLFCYLNNEGFEVKILNPLITDSNKNSGIRKVKSDKTDSLRIAKLGFTKDLKVSTLPSDLVLNLRTLTREYHRLVKDLTDHKNQLRSVLDVSIPTFNTVFKDSTCKTAIAILQKYKNPRGIITAPRKELIAFIAKNARRGTQFSTKKYNLLIDAAEHALVFGKQLVAQDIIVDNILSSIQMTISMIEKTKEDISNFIKQYSSTTFVKQIHLVESIKCIGIISAATLMSEIGDFSVFKKPKHLYAYFGLDPSVKQSGKFIGTRNRMSKRGSKIARKVLYNIAMVSVKKKSSNPFMRLYYEKKLLSKPKKVALGAIMHKFSNIIFAVLRDNKSFILKSPIHHRAQYNSSLSLVA